MLASVLSLLTLSAVVLVVPVFAGVLGLERRRHLAVREDPTRKARLSAAATLVGLASLGVAAVLHAHPVAAAVVAVLMVGAVLAWTPLTCRWAVRGVVVWALLVTAAVGLLAWLVERMVASSLSPVALAVSVTAWVLLLVSMVRVQRYARDLISTQAGVVTFSRRHKRSSLLRPAVSLVVLFAAGGVAAVATTNGGLAMRGRVPQAGSPGSPGSYAVPSTSPSLTSGAGAPSAVGIDLAASIWKRGGARPDVRPSTGASGPPSTGTGPLAALSAATTVPSMAAAPSAATKTGSHHAVVDPAAGSESQPSGRSRPTTVAARGATQGPTSGARPTPGPQPVADTSSLSTAVRTSPTRATSDSPKPTQNAPAESLGHVPGRPSTSPTPSLDQPVATPQPSSAPSDTPSSAPSDPSGPTPPGSSSPTPSDLPTLTPSDLGDPSPSDPPALTPARSRGSEPSDAPSQVGKVPGRSQDGPTRPTNAVSPGIGRRHLR